MEKRGNTGRNLRWTQWAKGGAHALNAEARAITLVNAQAKGKAKARATKGLAKDREKEGFASIVELRVISPGNV